MSSVAAPSKPEPRLLHCLKGHKGSVSNGQFTQNGNYFMSCGQDKTIRLWNPHKGLPIKDYKGPHNREVSGVSIYPDNSRFVSVGAEYAAFLWDVSTGRILRKFSGHEGKLYCCTLAPGAEVLLTGSYDKTVRLWDLKAHSSFKPIQTISDATDTLTSIAVTDHEIITASVDGHLRTYDIRAGKQYSDKMHHAIVSIALSRGKKNCIVMNCLDSTCRLVDRKTGEELNKFKGHKVTGQPIGCQLDPTDSNIVSGSESGELFFWDICEQNHATTIAHLSSQDAHPGGSLSCHYGPVSITHEGEESLPMLVTTGADGTVKVFAVR
eukprot:GHVN01031637.1.p1 GENE.GHVN01031637.1~~GHVN01031637.1.p1  ORF type:complete len:323 (-),score=26.60 GHVN01031637.1:171-1139(-)